MNNTDQIRELIEAYALGVLDPEERSAVEAHLSAGCAECARALDESRWLVGQLAHLAPEATPSGRVRARLMKTIRAEAPPTGTPTRVKPLIRLWMWGAVAAALIFAFYNAYEARTLRKAMRQMQADLTAQTKLLQDSARELAIARLEASILTDPKSLKISMPASNKEIPQLEASWSPSLGLVVTGQRLPLPPGNRTLQLWLIPKAPGAKPVPSLTLRPDVDGKFALIIQHPPDVPEDTKALAVTVEPAGGSPQPTSTPIWVGAVVSTS